MCSKEKEDRGVRESAFIPSKVTGQKDEESIARIDNSTQNAFLTHSEKDIALKYCKMLGMNEPCVV